MSIMSTRILLRSMLLSAVFLVGCQVHRYQVLGTQIPGTQVSAPSNQGRQLDVLESEDSQVVAMGRSMPFQWTLFGSSQLLAAAVPVHGVRVNLLGGVVYSLDGFEFGIVGTTEDHVYGVQANGLLNQSGGELHGAQFGGVANSAGDDVHGVQVAGLSNIAGSDLHGLQVAGLVNETGDDVHGLQIGGWANATGTDRTKGHSHVYGVQMAGFCNNGHVDGFQIAIVNGFMFSLRGHKGVSRGRLSGAQFGVINLVDRADGVQFGGLFNGAQRLSGCQIGGINRVERASGVQIGIFNSAENLSGVQIGLLNFNGNGWLRFLPILNIGS